MNFKSRFLVSKVFLLLALSLQSAPCAARLSPFDSDLGPWLNQDETLEFQVFPERLSWWLAAKECKNIGMRLPTWDELATNWQYLVGTTPINRKLADLQGCPLVCPSSMWTSDEKSATHAYDFSNFHPGEFDPRGAPKQIRYPVVCAATL